MPDIPTRGVCPRSHCVCTDCAGGGGCCQRYFQGGLRRRRLLGVTQRHPQRGAPPPPGGCGGATQQPPASDRRAAPSASPASNGRWAVAGGQCGRNLHGPPAPPPPSHQAHSAHWKSEERLRSPGRRRTAEKLADAARRAQPFWPPVTGGVAKGGLKTGTAADRASVPGARAALFVPFTTRSTLSLCPCLFIAGPLPRWWI